MIVHNECDESFEELWNSVYCEPPEPLFEEADTPPKEEDNSGPWAALKNRLDTLEYRLDRTLRCVNRCQTDQAALRKEQRELVREQETCRVRLDCLRKNLRLGLWIALGAILLGWLPKLAEVGQKLLDVLAALAQVEPGLAAGATLAVVLLGLILRLGRSLLSRLAHRRERGNDDVVSDR